MVTFNTMAPLPVNNAFYGPAPTLTEDVIRRTEDVARSVKSSVSTGAGLAAYMVAGVVSGVLTNKISTVIKRRVGVLSKYQEFALQAAVVALCLAVVQGFAASHLPAGQQATGMLLFISLFLVLQTNLNSSISGLATA